MRQYLVSVYEDGHLQLEGNTESGLPWNTIISIINNKEDYSPNFK